MQLDNDPIMKEIVIKNMMLSAAYCRIFEACVVHAKWDAVSPFLHQSQYGMHQLFYCSSAPAKAARRVADIMGAHRFTATKDAL
jgi:hypothetical protein